MVKTHQRLLIGCCLLLTGVAWAKSAGPQPTCRERYHAQTMFQANDDEAVLIAAVMGWCHRNKASLLWDERLAQVARWWSERLIGLAPAQDQMLPTDPIRTELRARGVTDGRIEPLSVQGPVKKAPAELQEFLDSQVVSSRFTHYAVGAVRAPDGQRMMSTLLISRRPVVLEPIPVCPLPGDRLPLKARLRPRYQHPSWLLTTPQGNTVKQPLFLEDGWYQSTLPLDEGKGVYRVEIMVKGPEGPEVAALFPLYVGVGRSVAPAPTLVAAEARYQTPEDVEEALTGWIQQERSKTGLPPLQANEKLSALARDHALELLAQRHAVHQTKGSGQLVDRLTRERVRFAQALENVSLSPSPRQAHDRFMESPGHRENILHPHVTQLGVGVAMERMSSSDIIAVCEVFVEPAQTQDLKARTRAMVQRINEHRKGQGRFALGLDEELSRLARQSVNRLALLGDSANADLEGDRVLAQLGSSVLFPKVLYFKTSRYSAVLSSETILDEGVNRLGLGIADLSAQPTPGESWIAIILAGK